MVRSLLAALILAVLIAATVVADAHARHYTVRATAYSGLCDGQTSHMADGTHVRWGSISSWWLPRHRELIFDRAIKLPGHHARRHFYTRDTGASFDIYFPTCSLMRWWAVRRIGFRLGGHHN